MLKRVGETESRHPCLSPIIVQNRSPMLLLKDCSSGLVTEVFDDLDKVGAADVFLHGYLHSLCSINYDNAFVFRVCQHFSFFQDIAVY